ncbi:segregation/condensation protein A [Oceanispirochaeta crateris]|uniref:Segregation and condensation protein A n=1 Tax=Oceanispirochaeta crateris TaxID=2518645 RepID=A0A5C1QLZ0_9SPIO|nr:segregation/condensation protein A [Oceanispirochaeta crateris]QEN07574.1 segregation/condensation protein A [Oceanispirochaeta crateris]
MSENVTFQLEQFEGPLDLLLFLIRKNEVNIYDIPIASITEQYLSYMKYATAVNLENVTEFYLLAATLLYIKSRMLLPVEIDFSDEIEDPREELVAKLIDYQKYKKLSELMTEQEKSTEWVIERKKKQRMLPFEDEKDLWEEVDVWELLQSFADVMGSLTQEAIVNLYEEVTVNEKITLIQELLEEKGEFGFTDILINPESIMEIVCAFLAVLESVKMRLIMVFQNRLFGDIMIKARKPEEVGGRNESQSGKIDN